MSKQWKDIDFADCPNCGDAVEGLTTSKEDGYFFDGDDVRCLGECGADLSMSCCSGEAWVSWNNEDTTPQPENDDE